MLQPFGHQREKMLGRRIRVALAWVKLAMFFKSPHHAFGYGSTVIDLVFP